MSHFHTKANNTFLHEPSKGPADFQILEALLLRLIETHAHFLHMLRYRARSIFRNVLLHVSLHQKEKSRTSKIS